MINMENQNEEQARPNMTYEKIRELAMVDVKRRLKLIQSKLLTWDVKDNVMPDGSIEKYFSYTLKDNAFINLTLNNYATIREIKYIVWRFNLKNEDIWME